MLGIQLICALCLLTTGGVNEGKDTITVYVAYEFGNDACNIRRHRTSSDVKKRSEICERIL